MRALFSPEVQGAVLRAVYGGLSLVEAAEQAGVGERTLRNWLSAGRKDPESEHGRFAAAVDEARDAAARADMSFDEFRGHVSRAVRAGSVQAMRVWLELHDRQQDEPDDPFAALDAAANGHNGQSTIDRLARQTRDRRTNRNKGDEQP